MNQPDRYARFVLPEGKVLVEYAKDTKISNAGTYTIRLEDHTLGNLLRQQLHTDPEVVFAGYRIPHPLDPLMVVRVQTTHKSSPAHAMLSAVGALRAEVQDIKEQLTQLAPRDPEPLLPEQQQQQQQQPGPYPPHQQQQYAGGGGGGYDVGGGGGYGGYGGGPPPPGAGGGGYGGGGGGYPQQPGAAGYGGYQ